MKEVMEWNDVPDKASREKISKGQLLLPNRHIMGHKVFLKVILTQEFPEN